MTTRRAALAVVAIVLAAGWVAPHARAADAIAAIERVKGSVVAVGTFQRGRSPPFQFMGTGFAVGDGTTIVTNAHVIPAHIDTEKMEVIAIAIPGGTPGNEAVNVREAKQIATETGYDLTLLKINGTPLPALKIRSSDTVREGQDVLFTGFPMGAVLGPFPVTHRGMISAISPIAIPQARAADLDPHTIKRLAEGPFPIFQLDGTAYPGNSGSPVYSADTGEVLGVINMVLVKATKETVLSQPSGITYAVPSRYIQALLLRAQ